MFVTDSKREKVSTDQLRVDATVAVENPIGYFSAVRTVSFDVPEGARAGEYEVFVGFERNSMQLHQVLAVRTSGEGSSGLGTSRIVV